MNNNRSDLEEKRVGETEFHFAETAFVNPTRES